jgi:crossover junction endodeoxyribonuclease RuvC
MRVLGIDPGLTRCGLGVVEGRPGRPPELLGVDVLRTASDLDTSRRLLRLEEELDAWLVEHRPDTVAVERVFAQHNVQTVMGTAQAAGVAMLVAARRGIPVATHTPSEVKAAITGSGRADKAQVTAMVTRILRLDAPPRPADAADALALAICQVWRGGITDRYEVARRSAAAVADRQRAALSRSRTSTPTASKSSTGTPSTGTPSTGTASTRRAS